MVSKLQTTSFSSETEVLEQGRGRKLHLPAIQQFEDLWRRSSRREIPVVRSQAGYDDELECSPRRVHELGWLARVLATSQPRRHADVSTSPILSAMAGAFVPTHWYACRPEPVELPGLRTISTNPLELPFRTASVDSLSCSGVIESLGLGQDGMPYDPEADLKCIDELKRALAPDGSLALVCPVGKPCVLFDSHRVYSFGQIMDYFEGLDLEEFALVPDTGSTCGLLINPDRRVTDRQTHGSGCFWFRKPAASK